MAAEYQAQVDALDTLTEGLRQDWKRDAQKAKRLSFRPPPPKYSFRSDLAWFLRRSLKRITEGGK